MENKNKLDKKSVILVILAILVGGMGGYSIGFDIGFEKGFSDHPHGEEDANMHMHEKTEAPDPKPEVDLIIHKDPMGGYNAQVILTNFKFAPENVSKENINGQGHAHIYNNDIKINRIYGEWYNLGKLPKGENEISVSLSTNNHKELTNNGELIVDSETIVVE